MKTKHIIAASSGAIIAGSIFYYVLRRRNTKLDTNMNNPTVLHNIRKIMRHAKQYAG